MRTATDHLREIAEDAGLNTEYSPEAWPHFMHLLRVYMFHREESDSQMRHSEAMKEQSLPEYYSAPLYECWRAIIDDPELWY